MAKRILVFTGYFYPHTGGCEISLYQLSKRLVQNGYAVDVVTCNTENAMAMETLDGISIYRLPAWNLAGRTYPTPKPTPETFRILYRLLRKKHDLILTYTRFFATAFVGLVTSKVKRKPLIHCELGSRHSVVPNKLMDMVGRAYDHTVGALVVRSATRLICNCNASSDFLKHLGARREPCVIPTAGVDFSVFRQVETDLKDRLCVGDAAVVTSVSRLVYAKGVQDLIKAFPRIKQEVGDTKLLIVGDGAYRQELEKLARSVDGNDIMFLGELPHQEVADVLNVTDLLVNPSYSEALTAYPVLEAGAMGISSVTTDVGGTREVIEDYETGLLVSPGDTDALGEKVCNLVKDRNLREYLGRNVQERVKAQFTWNNVVQHYSEVIESV